MDGKLQRGDITPQVILGLAVIAFGLILTLDNLGIVEARYVFRLWPLVFVVIGVSQIMRDRRGARIAASAPGPRALVGYPWILVGVVLFLSNFGIMHVHIWDLWPILLIVIGGYLVWHAQQRSQAPPPPHSGASVSAVAIMSGIQRKANSAAFTGGELTAVMGGVELDLRQAGLNGGEAVLDVFAFWGGIEVRVPENWTVVSKVMPLMGGYEDKTRPPKLDASQRLIVRGMVVMGGIEVSN